MSDAAISDFDEFFGSFESVDSSKKKERQAGEKKYTALKIIVAVLGFFLLAEGVIYAFILPCFGRPAVVYSGLDSVAKKDVAERLAPLANSTWTGFDTERAVSILSNISYIEQVSVDKRFPDRIFVSAKQRVPVAKTILSVNGVSKSVQIDENCVLFSIQSDSILQDSSVPLVSGLPIDNLQEGMRLPAKYHVLMEQISAIRSLPQKYFAAISEIQVVPKEYGNFELVLYPTQAKTRVLTDRSLTEDALKYMMVVLDVVNSIEPDVVEVDLRYDSLSYRCR
ncbi:cell division protein FtsQ/DivIB [Treponema sp.]|uniref:cell division protein FtsQ/DivIB n=1 Tax=Treponema sp. TaxID=166 RepID=UPI003EFC001C